MCLFQFVKLSFLLIVLNSFTKVLSFEIIQKVPQAVLVGDNVTLSCEFEVDDDQIYEVRWSLDYNEFYRSNSVKKEDFPVADLNIDMDKSNSTHVVIKSLTNIHSGEYECEVTLSGPIYYTEIKSSSMEVIQVPKRGPIIKAFVPITNDKQLSFGDRFNATCTTDFTDLALKITWNINKFQYVVNNSDEYHINNGEISSRILVKVNTETVQYSQGQPTLMVKCTTNIFNLYNESSQLQFNIREGDLNSSHILYSASNSILTSYFNSVLMSMLVILTKYML